MHIRLEGITKIYEQAGGEVPAVSDVWLDIESGEFFFLLGPSGCGKTTLLRIIAGLLVPTAGKVIFGDRDVTDLPVEKRNTAMVFQSYALWPHMTVQQNVEFAPKMQQVGRSRRREIASRQLDRVHMLEFSKRKPNQLSGGQQQRVALARALAAGADCLLLDEPLSNLDARLRLEMRGQLRQLVKSSGMTAVYVTHDQKEALSMADRIAVMNAGEIVQIGTPQELYDLPATRFVADFLGEANFIPGKLVDHGPPAKVLTPLGELLAGSAGDLKTGRDVTCCVRPERIAILTEPAEANEPATSLPAKVESTVYLGELRQYVVALTHRQGQFVWKVSVLAEQGPPLQPGREVTLRVTAADVCLLAE